jgi:hypothetical protein
VIVFIDRQKKAALMIDIEVPLTPKLSTTKAEKITKCENLALEIKNFWKMNLSIYSLVISVEGVVTRSFLKYIENTGLTKISLKVWQKAVLLQTCHTVRKFLGHAI